MNDLLSVDKIIIVSNGPKKDILDVAADAIVIRDSSWVLGNLYPRSKLLSRCSDDDVV